MNDSGMNEELEYLTYSPEYAQYIMENCGGDRMICNGDTLTDAMEDGYLWDEFLEDRADNTKKMHWKEFENKVAEYMKSQEYINSEG